MSVMQRAGFRSSLPAPVVRLLGMAGFVVGATLLWRLIVGEVTCLAWTSAVLIYLAGDTLLGRRRARPASVGPGA